MWHGGSEDVWQRHQPLDHLLAKPQVQPEWPYSGGGGLEVGPATQMDMGVIR